MDLKSINIRYATAQDIDSMVFLLSELLFVEGILDYSVDKLKLGMEMVLSEPGCFFIVAELDGDVVGMMNCQKHISTLDAAYILLIEDTVVSEKYRGMGIGKLMFDYVENVKKEGNYTRLQLQADRRNEATLKFYKNNGWQETNYTGFIKR